MNFKRFTGFGIRQQKDAWKQNRTNDRNRLVLSRNSSDRERDKQKGIRFGSSLHLQEAQPTVGKHGKDVDRIKLSIGLSSRKRCYSQNDPLAIGSNTTDHTRLYPREWCHWE